MQIIHVQGSRKFQENCNSFGTSNINRRKIFPIGLENLFIVKNHANIRLNWMPIFIFIVSQKYQKIELF